MIWFSLVRNNPDQDFLITAHEKRYLKQYCVNSPGKKVLHLREFETHSANLETVEICYEEIRGTDGFSSIA